MEAELARIEDGTLPGDVAFKLYDTYGFPVDLTADIARERDMTVDQAGFERAMAAQREKAKAASKFATTGEKGIRSELETDFLGYGGVEANGAVVALYRDGEEVEQLSSGDSGAVILDSTPFYAESGGQVGDTGLLADGKLRFAVTDTQKSGSANVHYGRLETGELRLGDAVRAAVDDERRQAIVLNHSATHLMHAALRTVPRRTCRPKGLVGCRGPAAVRFLALRSANP